MNSKLSIIFIVLTGCLFLAGNAWAWGTRSTSQYDYGDALGYDIAWHKDSSWQRLGTIWDDESSSLFNDQDKSDDGVSWSVDGGLTYGHADIRAGQTIKFKFDIYKKEWGRHATEQLAAWIDWDQDFAFANDSVERIAAESWDFRADYFEDTGTEAPYNDSNTDNSTTPYFDPWDITLDDDYFNTSIILDVLIPEYALGDYWLRARVACNFDVNPVTNFLPYGYVGQGEVEDWLLTVNPVPEPSTFLLLGGGLAGLAFAVRRRRKE